MPVNPTEKLSVLYTCKSNVWLQKISIAPPPPPIGSWNFLGVGRSKRDKFLKGNGVHKEFFFPEGFKCDHINTFPIVSGNQEKRKVLSIATDVGFLVIYFLLLFWRQTTHTALRHSSEYHVRRRVKQNGRQGNYCSQSLNIDRIERTYRGEVQQYDEDDNLLYILYFTDRIVFSLNASGAFSDGIAPADS